MLNLYCASNSTPFLYCPLYVLHISTLGSSTPILPIVCTSHFYCRKPGELSAPGLQPTLLPELVSLCLSLLHELTCACCLCALQFLGPCPGASSTVLLPIVLFLSSLLGEFGSRRSSAKGGQNSRAVAFQQFYYFTFLQAHSQVLLGVHSVRPWGKSSTWTLLHISPLHVHCSTSLHLHCSTSLHCTCTVTLLCSAQPSSETSALGTHWLSQSQCAVKCAEK